jgi:serine/threonine protein kinase
MEINSKVKMFKSYCQECIIDHKPGEKLIISRLLTNDQSSNFLKNFFILLNIGFKNIIKELRSEKFTKKMCGQGTFGRVFKVQRHNEEYAQKECPQDRKTTDYEFRIVERIMTHPKQSLHLVFFYMIYERGDNNYYLMEYMNKDSFQSVVTSGVFTHNEKFIKLLAFQLLNGLIHLHEYYDIIHCDFSPKNILMKQIGSEFFFKIADFGSSIFADKIRNQNIGNV